MKKALSLLLALVMVFALGANALAEAPATVTATPDMAGKTVILHTNDVHGAVEGYSRLAALKADYEARGAEVLLVDAGDYSQGTTYVSTTRGADAVALMNAAGYDVATLGNHEFDYGYAQLAENMKAAEFRVVCTNVLENGKPIFDANCICTTKSGLKIGFFGLETPEAQTKANPALIQGLTFLDGDALVRCAQTQVDALADADLVLCLSHLGVDAESAGHRSFELYANVPGIDMILDGHSHTVMTHGPVGEPIQSTGSSFANVGVIVIDNAAKTIERNELYALTEDAAQDETVAAAAKAIIDRVDAVYGAVFAKSDVTLNGAKAPNGNRDGETNNGDLITDAMLWQVMQNKAGLTVADDMVLAVTNGGGIRAAIQPGDVTRNNINTVLPFGNTVAVVYVTGAELLEALEASTFCTPTAVGGFPQVSGIKFTLDTTVGYDADAESYPGSTYHGPASIRRVTIDEVNGKAFDAAATYAVVTNNFCAAGGDTYYAFAAASAQFDTGIPLDEAVMAYVTEALDGVIGEKYAQPQGRITVRKNPFTDVANDAYYKDAVLWAVENGITSGAADDAFAPDRPVTRQEAMTFLYRFADKLLGKGAQGDSAVQPTFADWAEVADFAGTPAMWCVANEITQGDGTRLYPGRNITRQDAITMLYRFFQFNGDGYAAGSSFMYLLPFADRAEIAEYAMEAVLWCNQEGITTGGAGAAFDPAGSCTRSQFVTFLYRYAA